MSVRASLPRRSLCPQEGSARGVGMNQGSGPTDSPVMPKKKEENEGGDLEKKGTWPLPAKRYGQSQVGTRDGQAQSPGSDPWMLRDQLPRVQAKVPLFPYLSAKG